MERSVFDQSYRINTGRGGRIEISSIYGCLEAFLEESPEDGMPILYMNSIHVKPNYRSQGVATLMLEVLYEIAGNMDISLVRGELCPYEYPGDEQYYDPEKVRQFYIARGFEVETCAVTGKELISKRLF